MTRAKGIKDEIAGKAKQAIAEILGDQGLQEEGKAQEQDGKRQKDEPSKLNPLRRLNSLT